MRQWTLVGENVDSLVDTLRHVHQVVVVKCLLLLLCERGEVVWMRKVLTC